MFMNVFVIGLVLLIGYIWLSRGFFSAFLNLVCVVLAGAIGLAVWEPTAYFFLSKLPASFEGTAWAAALVLPFAATLGLLRVITDQLLPGNVDLDAASNAVGGGLCGALSGLITAGFLVIGIGFLRVDTDFMGYKPMSYEARGSIEHKQSLWLPADQLTASLYKALSRGSFASDTPLARWYPDLADVPYAIRLSYGEGKARNTIKPEDFEVWKRYTVGGKDAPFNSLLSDAWEPNAQNVNDSRGEKFDSSSRLEGFVVNFKSSAREKTGSVVIGPGQIRLLLEKPGDEPSYKTVYPIAVVMQGQSDKVAYARFRFDAGNVFMGSVGGASEAKMGFEFPAPAGYEPIALYVKNVRHEVDPAKKPEILATGADRDAQIKTGAIIGGRPAEIDSTQTRTSTVAQEEPSENPLLVRDAIGFVIQAGTERSMQVSGSFVVEGEETYDPKQLQKAQGVDKALRIDRFQTRESTVIMQLDVSPNSRSSWLGKSLDLAEGVVPPVLVDTQGQLYEPVGFIYRDSTKVVLRFNRSSPLRGLSQVPTLTRSRGDQKLTLIFDVSKGVEIKSFQLGSKVVMEFKPPVPATGR